MSSGLVTVKCTNCHQQTEIIPGTIVAECDHCGRLFRPAEGEGAASSPPAAAPAPSSFSSSPSTTSAQRPPWESAPGDGLKPGISPEAARREEEAQHQRDLADIRKLSGGGRTPGTGPVPFEDEPGEREATPPPARSSDPASAPRPVRPAPASTPSAVSAAPAVFIFVTLLVLAIGAYFMAKKDEAASDPKKSPAARRSQEPRPVRGPIQEDRTASDAPTDTPEPVTPPSKNLTPAQRVGMDQVEKHSVVLSSGQLDIVRRTITHRDSHPFHFWGSRIPKLEVVVFAPFTHMGIARLRQLNREFKKLEPFEDRIAVWFVFHWGSDQGIEAEAASLANAIHWTYKPEAMYHFVNLLQKEATWRVESLGKLDEYVRTVGLDPVKVRESLQTLPIQEIRQEVSEVMTALHLPDKDLTFLIGGRSYLDGKTLYNVSRIVDYELAARMP